MTVRDMAEADLAEVSLIEQQIFSRPWSRESFHTAFIRADSIYLVAEEEGHIVAYLGIWTGAQEGDLCNMAVLPGFRRQGIASALLSEAVCRCRRRGVCRLLLEVRKSNEAAKHLYEKFGFVELGIRRGYYSEPAEDALLMECSLGTAQDSPLP